MHRAVFASQAPNYRIPAPFRCATTASTSLSRRSVLNPAARHDAPAAPARFVGRKLREGREVRNAIRTGFAAKMGRYKNYEKLREIFQIDGYDEFGDFLADSVL